MRFSSNRIRITTSVVAVLFFVGAAHRLDAQDARTLLRQGIQAFNDFETDRALPLLRRGVNPTGGPQDSLWALGVQYIAQILFDEGQPRQAGAWARWGMRLAPGMRVDSINLVSEVIESLTAGRAAGAPSPGDAFTTTAYSWPFGDPGGGQGRVDVTSSPLPVPVSVVVVGSGVVVPGRGIALSAGTHQIRATAQGYQTLEVSREVLPGVTTIVSFSLQPVTIIAADELPDDVRDAAMRQVASITVHRFGTAPVCGAGALAGRDGLLLTTYSAVRGADRVEVALVGRRFAQDVQVAAYDVGADLAVLKVPVVRADSMSIATSISDGQYAWAVAYSDCASPSELRTRVTTWRNRPTGALALSDSLANAVFGSPLFDQQGALVGLSTGGRSALAAPRATSMLDRARRSVNAQQLQTFATVALAENHRYGSVAISSTVRNGVARITPLERWQWAALAQTAFVPLTFAGPEGRYRLELTVNGQIQRTVDFTLRPGVADRLAVNPEQMAQGPQPALEPQDGGGGFPWIVAVLGAVGAGAAGVFLLGGGDGPPPSQTGTITFRIPDRD